MSDCQVCGCYLIPSEAHEDRFCAECWELEELRRENSPGSLNRALVAAVCGGSDVEISAWCHWSAQRVENSRVTTATVVGGLLGGAAGAVVGSAIGDALRDWSANIGLIAVTNTELVVVDLGGFTADSLDRLIPHNLDKIEALKESGDLGRYAARCAKADAGVSRDGDQLVVRVGRERFQLSVVTSKGAAASRLAGLICSAVSGVRELPPVPEFVDLVVTGAIHDDARLLDGAVNDDGYLQQVCRRVSSLEDSAKSRFFSNTVRAGGGFKVLIEAWLVEQSEKSGSVRCVALVTLSVLAGGLSVVQLLTAGSFVLELAAVTAVLAAVAAWALRGRRRALYYRSELEKLHATGA